VSSTGETAPVRRRDGERTRAALVDAASEVFARRGFDSASLDEIAEAAGFSRGAIHFHFASKEDLFLAVIDRRNETFLAAYEDLPADAPVDAAASTARWRELHRGDDVDVALRIELHARTLRNPALRERVIDVDRRAVAATAARFAESAERHGVRWRYPVERMAELVHVVSRGLLERAAVRGTDESDLMEMFLSIVGREGIES